MRRHVTSAVSVGAIFICVLLAACGGGGSGGTTPLAGSGKSPIQVAPVGSGIPQAVVPISTASPGTFPHQVNVGGAVQFIAVGPDRLYFSGQEIGSLTYQGTPAAGVALGDGGTPADLTEGIDGAMYYAENLGNLSKFVPTGVAAGTMTHWNDFGVTTAGTNDVTTDPNGDLWFTEFNNSSVIRMTTWGSLLGRTALSSGAEPLHSAVGQDQASIWVTEIGTSKIAQINLSGTLLNEFPLPTGCGSSPAGIALASDGNLYFDERENSSTAQEYLGQITPSGTITCFANPNVGDSTGIAEGPDGNIWIMEYQADKIVKFNVTTLTFGTPITAPGNRPQTLVLGADGELWYSNDPGDLIVSFQPN